MIKRVEVNYRGIFQKNLGKKIGSDIVMIASRMGRKAFRPVLLRVEAGEVSADDLVIAESFDAFRT